MTQPDAFRKFVLSRAPRHFKVLITSFGIVMFVALCAGVVSFWGRTGMTPAGIAAWYRGDGVLNGGTGAPMAAKSLREMMDATWLQLLGQGSAFFILAGLTALTTLAASRKIALFIAASSAILLDAAAPWLIRYVAGPLAPLQIVTTLAVVLIGTILVIVPLREAWSTEMPVAAASADDEPIFPPRPGESRPKRERPRRGERRDGDRRDGDRRPRRHAARRPNMAVDAVGGTPAGVIASTEADSAADRSEADSASSPDDRRSRRRRRWRGRGRPSGASSSPGETVGAGADRGGPSFGGE